jgi:hypothetical protein
MYRLLWTPVSLDLLSLVEVVDEEVKMATATINQATADLGMNVNRANAIIDAANCLSAMRSRNGDFRHRFMELPARKSHPATRSIIPVRPNDPFDLDVMRQFADRIEALRGSSILAEGVNAYVEFLWDSERCPVFADPHKNGRAAAAFLKLLYKLDIYDKEIRYGSFDCRGSASRAQWREKLGLRDRRPFERWPVPFEDCKSVRPWLGIKPTFGPETVVHSPGLFGFRFIMVMTNFVLKADGATSRES